MRRIRVGMRGMGMEMLEMRGMQGIRMRMWGIGVGMRGIRVGMRGIRVILCENLHDYCFG